MDGLKAATPMSALNSVRDFSASGHPSANFKNIYWVQPPPQALRFSHGIDERETSDW